MPSRTTVETYTVRNRRSNYEETHRAKEPSRLTRAATKAAPAPRPQKPPAPFGDLSRAGVVELCDLARHVWACSVPVWSGEAPGRGPDAVRTPGDVPGETWQERWEASGFDDENAQPVGILGRPDVRYDRSNLTSALRMAFAARVIQPSLAGFRANKCIDYADPFRQVQKDPGLDEFFRTVDSEHKLTAVHWHRAKLEVTCALTTQGIALENLTQSALLHYSLENKRLGVTHGANKDTTRFAALGAWEPGRDPPQDGALPARLAADLADVHLRRPADHRGTRRRYAIKNQDIRQLLIDYLTRRKSDTDYISRHLASLFWSVIEELSPGQKDLNLSPELYNQWRAEIQEAYSRGFTSPFCRRRGR
ncbi:hypothetical protein ACGFX8_33645 [Streptomyces sp. NPDC048362]|uniref:hypothetical protein n=1 Tax=Streptomyces sp. NPDC048362 TaxID=3365539 RepID=UPI003716E52A